MGVKPIVTWLLMIAPIVPSHVQGIDLPEVVMSQTIEGVTIEFPVRSTVGQSDPSQPIVIVAKVDLSDLTSRIDKLIGAAWATRDMDLAGRLRPTVLSCRLRVRLYGRNYISM